MRIVSLLPSTTEILFGLGAGEDVVGVTFECDTPAEARSRTVVSTSAMPSGLSPAEIDAYVVAAVARGEDLYHLAADALRSLDPTLVVTQDLCAVCAVDVTTVDEALAHLGLPRRGAHRRPAHARGGAGLGAAARQGDGPRRAAAELVGSLRLRMAAVWRSTMGRPRPRVAVLEWTDPPYAPGHWIPEMVELAGGESVLGTAGQKSVRITWEDLHAARPDVVVVAPCGYDRARRPGAGRRDRGRACPPASACTRWTPTACGPGQVRGSIDGVEELASVLRGADGARSQALVNPTVPITTQTRLSAADGQAP